MSAAARLTICAMLALAGPRARAAAQGPDASGAGRPPADPLGGVGTGTVRLSYAVRRHVCGDGADGVSVGDSLGVTRVGRWGGRAGGTASGCETGPARVAIDVRGGVARALHLAVGGPGRAAPPPEHATVPTPGGVRDLGVLGGAAAAAYLLGVAAHAPGEAGERAVLAAAIADSAVIWPELLRLARDVAASPGARRAAAFWAGQSACDAIRARATPASAADTAGRDVRRQVVFALSQRASDDRTSMLTRVARVDRDPEVRCSALFWLGQTADGTGSARAALQLSEDVLRAR